jgi:hypothetical protein
MKNLVLFFCLFFTSPSFADFGEIDLMVQDSIEDFFDYLGYEVNLKSLEYEGEPVLKNDILEIYTTVDGIQGYTYKWGLYECTTQIRVLSPGKYEDLGSDCFYDTDR